MGGDGRSKKTKTKTATVKAQKSTVAVTRRTTDKRNEWGLMNRRHEDDDEGFEGGERREDRPTKGHSRVEHLLVRIERTRAVLPVLEDDEELGDGEELAGVARGEAEGGEEAEAGAGEARLLVRVEEEGRGKGPLFGREGGRAAVGVAAQLEVGTAESWEVWDADAPHRRRSIRGQAGGCGGG